MLKGYVNCLYLKTKLKKLLQPNYTKIANRNDKHKNIFLKKIYVEILNWSFPASFTFFSVMSTYAMQINYCQTKVL